MFKRLTALLLLLLFALPACAEEAPVLSGDMLLLQKANAALYERYGLTMCTLGLFSATVTRYGDVTIVRYTPACALDPGLLGEYAVILAPEGPTARWTHDDVDPSLWRSGDLHSPAWGEPQLAPYLLLDGIARGGYSLPYAQPAVPATREEFAAQGGHLTSYAILAWPYCPLYQLPVAMAQEAVRKMYDLPESYTAALCANELYLAEHADGQRVWIVSLTFPCDAPAMPDTPMDRDCFFIVVLDEADWTVLDLRIESGGLG